ncbi:fumarylacetoacetate hydrolase family protein [uncultured Tateyamaria sp.]|uniref:fumarylacetoacetate hydrolase family protein n=1 Tax=uncultured Tateyamaria sp. TaxID=455651 RepID=UPI002636D6D0|nr:fumarylacetoacetate hydrolase family protein [uncultured Tateyamaria sp.]
MRPVLYIPVLAALIPIALVFGIQDDPERTNPISAEAEILKPAILPVTQGFTLALTQDEAGRPAPLLVTNLSGAEISAIDLTEHGAENTKDLFGAMRDVGERQLTMLFRQAQEPGNADLTQSYGFDGLLSVAGSGNRHVASGTNFVEHAEETQSQSVFNFPKFGQPTPPVTEVTHAPGVLLDYEVELCMLFDRNIATIDDFDEAEKGLFLCGDFTDRAVLSRMIDVDNFDSGSGFSDAKSGPDFFPTGGFLVVPNDWKSFVGNERIVTFRNGQLRQDARGGEMILDFRQLTERVLADATSTRFVYQGRAHTLIEDRRISLGQVLMSGTPEGVIFMPPSWRQMTRGVIRYLWSGAFLNGTSGYEGVVNSFIRDELESKRFLQPDEQITYVSASMGTVSVTVVGDGGDATGLQTASSLPVEIEWNDPS